MGHWDEKDYKLQNLAIFTMISVDWNPWEK